MVEILSNNIGNNLIPYRLIILKFTHGIEKDGFYDACFPTDIEYIIKKRYL